jgi:hypothetical protein
MLRYHLAIPQVYQTRNLAMTAIKTFVKLTLKAARAICGTIGFPSKMPGTSYGIPAQACITGAKLAQIEGSVCFDCYALRGNYLYPSVQKAQQTRLMGINHHHWVDAVVTLLENDHAPEKNLPPYHRWHDSGDLQSIEHLGKLCEIAERMPHIQHWIPTKEPKIVRDYVRNGGTIPDNLIIRLSGTMVNGNPPKAWPHTSTVYVAGRGAPIGYACPAYKQNHKCQDCRACWDKSIPNISYPKHR